MNEILDFVADFLEFILLAVVILTFMLYVYDRYVQRQHALLINYPVIGRGRYFLEALREPMRQYFADEKFYESRDKVEWVYKAAKNKPNYQSFSVGASFSDSRFILKHATSVLNEDEVSEDTTVLFGKNRIRPFRSASPIIRSAMSDGALSPEGVRAFSLGAKQGNFTINCGEGGLTTNHLFTHIPDIKKCDYLEVVPGTPIAELVFKLSTFFFNHSIAIKNYRKVLLNKKTENTYVYDPKNHGLFRVNWNAPLSAFPAEVPEDLPDMVFQMSSGLYGVRDADGEFDPERYAKVMRFCKMTEIKIAQGAKQTGGKLAGAKVSADIAYYRGVEEGKDVFSPNRFPYAHSEDELLDFIGNLQHISEKPVGMKIVISDIRHVEDIVSHMATRAKKGESIPDFITVDSGDGGSATAPLELMESVGLKTNNALFILDTLLKKYELRDDVKIIASGKILTPDDVVITLAMGADAVGIARGFMMSAGCIRARMCSGYGSHKCPVGLATQDKKKRASYLVVKEAGEIASYHRNLIKGMKVILAVMGLEKASMLNKDHLTFKSENGEIYFDIEKYFHHKLHI